MKRLLVTLMFVAVGSAQAQRGNAARTRPCILDWQGTSDSSRTTLSKSSSGRWMTFMGGGVRAVCKGTGMVLSGDSLEYSQDVAVMTIVGNTRYTEDTTTITTANLMRYNQNTLQVTAEGAVKILMKNGSTVEADLLQYLRPTPGRNYSSADASGHTRLMLRDSLGAPDSVTTVITSERLHMLRDTLFYAARDVVITRPDLIGTADSAATNSKTRRVTLLGAKPQLKGSGARVFTIDGNVLDIYGRENQIERLLARGKAVAVSDSLTLSADTLDMRTTGTSIDRVEAWGGGRARALSPGRDISARRLLISMPGQKLQDLRAYGKARAETAPTDSSFVATERDWIEGDTLTAVFEQTVSAEATQPPMRSLVARGSARSFYHLKSENTRCLEPTLSYVTGTNIEVIFKTGLMNEVQVTGNVRGLNAEPCKTASDSVPPRRGGTR